MKRRHGGKTRRRKRLGLGPGSRDPGRKRRKQEKEEGREGLGQQATALSLCFFLVCGREGNPRTEEKESGKTFLETFFGARTDPQK